MSSTGTFGINSDNFNISGNTNINNLVVSGTTSFPSNSISGGAISSSVANANNINMIDNAGGNNLYYPCLISSTGTTTTNYPLSTTATATSLNADNGLYYNVLTHTLYATLFSGSISKVQLTSDTTTATSQYILFSANQSGSGACKTNTNITVIPSTGALSCGPLTTTGTITLPTATTPYNATTGTGTGNLGCIISGTIATTYSSTAIATPSTLSNITLSPGVWMITASISATASTSGAGLFLCISTAGSTTFNKNASSVSVASTTNAGGSISTVISTTAAAPVYNFLCYSSAGTGSSVVGQFYAVRIA